jgi:hypothetical protein
LLLTKQTLIHFYFLFFSKKSSLLHNFTFIGTFAAVKGIYDWQKSLIKQLTPLDYLYEGCIA